MQSNMYGCGGLESNPAYKGSYNIIDVMLSLIGKIHMPSSFFMTEPGILCSGSEEHLKCDDTAIPRHMNPCYEYSISVEGNNA